MTEANDRLSDASYVCHVFRAKDMVVTAGVNTGDLLGAPDHLCLGDVYEVDEHAQALRLAVHDPAEHSGSSALGASTRAARVAGLSETGTPGETVAPEARLTYMAPDGARAELLVILIGEDQRVFLPLGPFEPRVEYTLVVVDGDPGPVQLSDITSVAFARGTHITMAEGLQRPVEQLRPGDLVLTRDHGPQPVRHILSRTVRAVGAFAPVAIPKGTLGNAQDLVLSQHQRLFIYQRGPNRIADRAEILVKAGDLVDGKAITVRKGGFADYVSLVFDRHEVIYAECIPAESLLVNEATKRQLDEDARAEIEAELPALSQAPVLAADAPASSLGALKRAYLKRATRS